MELEATEQSQAVKTSNASIAEAIPSHGTLPLAEETKTWTPNYTYTRPLPLPHEAGTDLYTSNLQAESTEHRHKRHKTDSVKQPATTELRRSPGAPVSGDTPSSSSATPRQQETHVSSVDSNRHAASWRPEDDELLIQARQEGLKWQPIALRYFPHKTANACRKRHAKLTEKRGSAAKWDSAEAETLDKAYVKVREQMWTLLADRVGEKWQNVEVKVCHLTCS